MLLRGSPNTLGMRNHTVAIETLGIAKNLEPADADAAYRPDFGLVAGFLERVLELTGIDRRFAPHEGCGDVGRDQRSTHNRLTNGSGRRDRQYGNAARYRDECADKQTAQRLERPGVRRHRQQRSASQKDRLQLHQAMAQTLRM